ncbi:MAG: hypothetical protein GX614_02150 [Sandaracinaceae bacterium]|nr:hypothetical protein [Sandaracinaceae bacterium]
MKRDLVVLFGGDGAAVRIALAFDAIRIGLAEIRRGVAGFAAEIAGST